MHAAEHVLVRVHTDDGIVGVAEAPPRPFTYGETQTGIVAVIEQYFAPALIGLTLTEREVAHTRMARTVGNPTAKAAIDMAMWDALGQSLRLSVSEMLGGYTDRMRVSHMLGFDDPVKMVAEAERIRETYGINTFKVKVGRRPVQLDTAVVRALRERFGDAIELYVDGNRGWSAADHCVRCARWPIWTCFSPRSCARPTTCSAGAGWSGNSTCRSSPTNPSRPRQM